MSTSKKISNKQTNKQRMNPSSYHSDFQVPIHVIASMVLPFSRPCVVLFYQLPAPLGTRSHVSEVLRPLRVADTKQCGGYLSSGTRTSASLQSAGHCFLLPSAAGKAALSPLPESLRKQKGPLTPKIFYFHLTSRVI